jgi:MFS family permease
MTDAQTPSDPAAKTTRYGRYVLVVFLLTNACSFIDRKILSILLVPIKAEFHLSDTQLGFLTGLSFALFFAIMGLPFGWLADRTNRRNLISGALMIFSGMTMLSGFSVNYMMLAIARMGVGVGEAGITPSVHSMTSDMFSAKQRASALSWYAAGINVGGALGLIIGGWATQLYSWRAAFWIAGIPGLILAVVVRLTVREPIRGSMDERKTATPPAPIKLIEGVKFIWAQPAFRHAAVAGGLCSAVTNGLVAFAPTFLHRSFGASSGLVGTTLALVMAFAGGIGTLTAGRLVDHFGRNDAARGINVMIVSHLIAAPLLVLAMFQQTFSSFMLVYALPSFLGTFFAAPTASMAQSLSPTRMRASAAALLFLIFAVIGSGMGPQITGILSDILTPRFGADGLRYALMALALGYPWAAFHYYMARRTYSADMARAQAAN